MWSVTKRLTVTPTQDQADAEIEAKEARWWYLFPGEDGWDVPLHAYLGFTEAQWRARALGGTE